LISGIYDRDPIRANEMSSKHNVHSYSSLNELLKESQAVSHVTPTSTHYFVADKALNAGLKRSICPT
jgi:predicted dehydrogenase